MFLIVGRKIRARPRCVSGEKSDYHYPTSLQSALYRTISTPQTYATTDPDWRVARRNQFFVVWQIKRTHARARIYVCNNGSILPHRSSYVIAYSNHGNYGRKINRYRVRSSRTNEKSVRDRKEARERKRETEKFIIDPLRLFP